jgi:hypothetical protein
MIGESAGIFAGDKGALIRSGTVFDEFEIKT